MNKTAEYLLPHMDRLKGLIEMLHTYIQKGIEYIHWAKQWIETIMDYLEKGIDYLNKYLDGNKPQHPTEEHMFV